MSITPVLFWDARHPRERRCPRRNSLCPSVPAPGNQSPTSCVCGSAYSGHGPRGILRRVLMGTGSFPLASVPDVHPIFASALPPFLRPRIFHPAPPPSTGSQTLGSSPLWGCHYVAPTDTQEHKLSCASPLSMIPGRVSLVVLVGPRASLCLAFQETAQLSLQRRHHSPPPSNAQDLRPHVLADTDGCVLDVSRSKGEKEHLVISICIDLMTNEVEHFSWACWPFICLL